MVDFFESLRSGMSAAEVAEKNKQEIALVFEELNRQLAAGLGGQVLIEVRTATNVVAEFLYGKGAIFASNPREPSKESKKLAGWRSGLKGYPCIIALADKEISCEDRQALEETLKLMLASPDVGEKFGA